MLGNDLTRGGIGKTLLRFTTPFLIANLLQTLYGIVDLFIVGRFTDSAQLSAVSISSLLMATVNFVVMGMGTGATVLVGQMLGAKRERDLQETISTVFCLFPLLALALMAVLLPLRGSVLRAMNTPAEAFAGAEAYLRICLYGLLFTGMYNAIAAVLRGMGESRVPTIFVAISCAFNVVGDIFCVGVLDMGAAGAALSTTVSQGLSVAVGFLYLRRRSFPFDFRPSSFRMKRDKFLDLLRIGTPTAMQEMLVMLSFIVLEAIINGMGYVAVAAAGVADRIFNVAVVPASSFSASIAAMVAQNTGAGLHERSRRCLRIGLAFSFAIGVAIFALMWAFPGRIIAVFTPDADVIAAGQEYMSFYKFEYLFCALSFCINGYINGIGRTRYTMVVNLVSSFVIRLPLVYWLSRLPGATLYHIGFALPTASAAQALLGAAFLLVSHRKLRRAARLTDPKDG